MAARVSKISAATNGSSPPEMSEESEEPTTVQFKVCVCVRAQGKRGARWSSWDKEGGRARRR